MMVYLICYGLMVCIVAYCIGDAIRFLPKTSDKILYTLSCLLMKPILLPILLPGSYFESPIAKRRFPNQIKFELEGIEQTNFMMAVQETNFLISFTLSTLSTSVTIFVILIEETYDQD